MYAVRGFFGFLEFAALGDVEEVEEGGEPRDEDPGAGVGAAEGRREGGQEEHDTPLSVVIAFLILAGVCSVGVGELGADAPGKLSGAILTPGPGKYD
jgi:hypothetical protein